MLKALCICTLYFYSFVAVSSLTWAQQGGALHLTLRGTDSVNDRANGVEKSICTPWKWIVKV